MQIWGTWVQRVADVAPRPTLFSLFLSRQGCQEQEKYDTSRLQATVLVSKASPFQDSLPFTLSEFRD